MADKTYNSPTNRTLTVEVKVVPLFQTESRPDDCSYVLVSSAGDQQMVSDGQFPEVELHGNVRLLKTRFFVEPGATYTLYLVLSNGSHITIYDGIQGSKLVSDSNGVALPPLETSAGWVIPRYSDYDAEVLGGQDP